MKVIKKITHYVLFRQVAADSKYYFTRTWIEGHEDKFTWFTGHETEMGVAGIGGELIEIAAIKLEAQYQAAIEPQYREQLQPKRQICMAEVQGDRCFRGSCSCPMEK